MLEVNRSLLFNTFFEWEIRLKTLVCCGTLAPSGLAKVTGQVFVLEFVVVAMEVVYKAIELAKLLALVVRSWLVWCSGSWCFPAVRESAFAHLLTLPNSSESPVTRCV